MGDLKQKPGAFTPGARTLSVGALNKMNEATPRQLAGGAGVNTTKFGDRVVFRQQSKPISPKVVVAIMTIQEELNDYLVCDYDGATVFVAKPFTLRGSVVGYVVGDEVVAVRVPSARVAGADGELIVWIVSGTGEGGTGHLEVRCVAKWCAYEGD